MKKFKSIFDSHIHSIFRTTWDFKKLKKEGVTHVLTVSYLPFKPKYHQTIIDSFDWIVNEEIERVKRAGVNIFSAVGVHPRCIPQDIQEEREDKLGEKEVLIKNEILKEIIYKIEQLIKDRKAIAIGEVGLEVGNQIEKAIFIEQIKLGIRLSVPVIVHTPRQDKRNITKEIIGIINQVIEEDRIKNTEALNKIIIDHVTKESIDLLVDTKFSIGLTVQKGKLSPSDFVELLKKYGTEKPGKFLLNTDLGADKAHLFSAKRAYKELFRRNVDLQLIKNVCFENAIRLFLR